jgi:cytochrome c oxidase cbb3-type subunit 3
MIKDGNDLILLFTIGILISIVLVLLVMLMALASMMQSMIGSEQGKPAFDSSKFWQKLGSLKPLSKEKELLLNEDYDGIKELDNPVPAWFNALFYGTVAFGLLYLLVYHNWDLAPLQKQEYDEEVYAAQLASQERLKNAPIDDINENNVKESKDQSVITSGKAAYIQYCAACHGQKGEGGVGPNLTDEYWIHGGTLAAVFKTIKYGVPEKGMVAWGTQITPTKISNISNFITSLQGTNPPNSKAPQGEKMQ